jgi:disulfide bond formation protein DsbB
MDIIKLVTNTLSAFVIALQIALVLFLIYKLFKKTAKIKTKSLDKISGFIENNALLFIFIFSLVSTLGSLFFSEIAHYEPCRLCWFQRIFMYPTALISGVALFFKKKDIAYYTLALSMIGGAISLYHNIGLFTYKTSSAVCSATGPSCFINYFINFGYVTLPLMALTGFLAIFTLSVISLKKN